jgi:hypothetical protein
LLLTTNQRLPKSEDDSAISCRPEILNLPRPHESLREWTEKSIDPGVLIAAMEAVLQIARSQPNFEEQRLARKTAAQIHLLIRTGAFRDPNRSPALPKWEEC